MTSVISITSSLKGVGRKSLALNLAQSVAAQGCRTLLMTTEQAADWIYFPAKKTTAATMAQVATRHLKLRDCIFPLERYLDVLPMQVDSDRLSALGTEDVNHLVQAFEGLATYDLCFISVSPHASAANLALNLAADDLIMTVSTANAALSEAYRQLKALNLNGFRKRVMLLFNQSPDVQATKTAFVKLQQSVQNSLNLKLVPLGTILHDRQVVQATKKKKPLSVLFPKSQATLALASIGRKVIQSTTAASAGSDALTFGSRFFDTLTAPLSIPHGEEGMPLSQKPVAVTPGVNNPPKAYENRVKPQAAATPGSTVTTQQSISPTELALILSKLAAGVDAIAQELKSIRNLLDKDRLQNVPGAESGLQSGTRTTKIPLDFEAFAAHQRKKSKQA